MIPTFQMGMIGGIKSYSELIKLQSFSDRFLYLMLFGKVADETFGPDRYLNQSFYESSIWKKTKRDVILRDNGCNLGVPGYDINSAIYVHHIDPITVEDIIYKTDKLLNPDNLISTNLQTHNAIHYGNKDFLKIYDWQPRTQNDLFPWRETHE